jgi:predicted DNA-binding transcriptional regulator YafY
MRLIVDSQRVSEHEVAAMVRGDGALEGVTAWASSERAAIQQAINVYFRVEEAKSAPTVTLTAPSYVPHPYQWNDSPAHIKRRLLEAAKRQGSHRHRVTIRYEDASGAVTERNILVSEYDSSGFAYDKIVAYDEAKQEPRTFRVDRVLAVKDVA